MSVFTQFKIPHKDDLKITHWSKKENFENSEEDSDIRGLDLYAITAIWTEMRSKGKP